jgi:hypothetical protein
MTHNQITRASHNYSIVEDLAQAPYAMSALEVLQICLTQHEALLFSISEVDPLESSLITFDSNHFNHMISHQITFQIKVRVPGKNILHTVVDEGALACIMSMSCWKAIIFLKINTYSTILK